MVPTTTRSGATAQKAFGDNGTYTVRLRVQDGEGETVVASHDVVVTNRKPSAFFDYTPTSPATAEMITFTSHSTDADGTVAALDWDLDNDGAYDDASGVNAQRSFSSSGSYPIRLRVTDDDGATETFSASVTVANRVPVAGFTFLPVAPLTGEQVTFTSASSDPDGSIASYAWDLDDDGQFDDGTNATAQKGFPDNGTFTVSLRVTDNGGAFDVTSSTVTIANRAPTAAFSSTPASPLTAQNITFTSSSSDADGSIASNAWDLDNDGAFDDGTAGTAQKSFPTSGTYTIRLQVTDSDGATDIVTHTVTVSNRAPAAGFDYLPTTPDTGQQVTFTSTSTDSDGTVAQLAWDLDDDGTFDDGTAASVQRTFSVGGDHIVRLLITDNEGATNIATHTVTVANRLPVSSFTHAPASAQTNEPVTFTSTAIDADGFISAYAWDTDNDGAFDDGTNATAQRSFPNNGTFTVRLRATDNNGGSTIGTDTVTIANRAPTAQIGFTPDTPITNETVEFSSTSTDSDGSIASYAWDLDNDGTFDDGASSTAERSFPSTGPYTISLRVTDDDGASATASIAITPGNRQPVAGFNFTPTSPQTGQAVSFTSTSNDPDGTITSYAWDTDDDGAFDDGTLSSAQQTFTTPGVHTVSLRVTDNDGAANTISRDVTATNRAPAAGFDIAQSAPLTGEQVDFESTSTDPDGTIAAFAWDLDEDGTFDDGAGPSAQRTFLDSGTFTVRLRVTDNSGATNTATRTVTVANRPPVAFFQFAPEAPLSGQTVTFTAASTDPDGAIASRAWDLDDDGVFDDGTTIAVTRSFPTGGSYTVRLRATDDDGATHVLEQTVNVANRAPTVDITALPASVATGQPVLLTAVANDPDGTIASYAWDTDNDGNFDNGATPSVQPAYAANGPVTVRLRVTDNSGAASIATKSVTILNRAPTANFTQEPAAPLTLEAVTFTSSSTDPDGSISTFAWDLDNDGSFDDGAGSSAQRTFADDGTYTIGLRVTDDDGGTSEISKVVSVTNRPPVASFNYSPLTVNPFDTVDFASSSTDPDGLLAAYAWDLDGDGQFDDATGAQVQRRNAFRTVGTHTVRLRVTDDDGATNVATVEVFVGNRPPVSSFVYTPHNPLVNQQVSFFSTATDPDSTIQPAGLEWDLNGDGQFNDATGGAASRVFPAPGAYNVGLRVTDPDGATSTYTDTVNVATPAPAAVTTQPGPQLISPFPVVRVAGRVYSGGTRLRMLSVNVPSGTTVTVRCSGKGCPFTSSRQSTASAGPRPATTIRIKRLEKRLLRNGVMVKIFITRAGAVGKFTSIKIRGRKSPLRVDRCLMPGQMKPVQCPS